MSHSSIEEIIEDYRNGKMVIITDDEDRENEGDLMMDLFNFNRKPL